MKTSAKLQKEIFLLIINNIFLRKREKEYWIGILPRLRNEELKKTLLFFRNCNENTSNILQEELSLFERSILSGQKKKISLKEKKNKKNEDKYIQELENILETEA